MIHEGFELFVSRHEISFAIDFDEHSDFPPGVDMASTNPWLVSRTGFSQGAANRFCRR